MKFVAQLEVLAAWTHSIHKFCITSMAMLLSRERNVPRQERDGCWLYGAQNEGFHVQRVGRCINGREKQDCFGRKAREVRREDCRYHGWNRCQEESCCSNQKHTFRTIRI